MRTLGVPPGVLVCTAEVGGLERFLPPTGCYAGLCRGLDRRPLRSDELSRLVRSELRIRRPKFESFVAIELSEHEMTPTDRPPGVQFVLRTGRCTHSSGDVRGVSSEIASTTLGVVPTDLVDESRHRGLPAEPGVGTALIVGVDPR